MSAKIRISKRRALNLMRRFLAGEALTSRQVRRWETEDLASLGFRVQGEQAFGYTAGAGLTHYFLEEWQRADAEASYQRLLESTPEEIATAHERDWARITSAERVSCVLCYREMRRETAVCT